MNSESLEIAEPIAEQTTPSRLADFYELTKPRMNMLVTITTMVGFCIASRDGINWLRLIHTLIGTFLTASAAGVTNQFIERRLDELMPRTRNRPLPGKRISPTEALLFGIFLGVAGVAYLAITVNALTALLAAFTLISYLAVYTPMKRISTLNTVIGAVPGAIPPMMGFAAASGVISAQALAMFGILFFWQMPHFLAIAILYKRDYDLAGFKMLPCVDEALTARQMVIYSLALLPVSLLPVPLGMAGTVYFTAAVLLGLAFLSFAVSCAATRARLDARKLFFASIIYLPVLLAIMMIDKV
ncbi:MAG TPA: heme o synthase [Tepidisphaeraceae bacterium]|jgi:protoheme IX farnesyltransferase|nr:heme o synthase [Tepidisphaeraceae bacterium]